MKNQLLTRFLAPLTMAGLLSTFGVAAPAPTTPAVGEKAGKITALLPLTHVVRGQGKQAVTTDAVRGQDVVWQDLVKTEKGGRARITLNDNSILSLGSQAELRIVKHDAKAQQTELEMTVGRVRAQVSTITRDGGSFQVRTPTAVAGVIGTDFGTDSSEVGTTTFVCISGTTQIGNIDPKVPGTVLCTAGQTTTVKSGMPPTPPKPATQQQIQQLIADTEPASISAFAPASALVGATLDAVATGTHMAGISGTTVSGTGVRATLGPNGTATTATAHLVIAPTAQPGPYVVTFTKPNGANTAAVFTVIAPPGLQGTDSASLTKRYTDILTTEQQAADASNATIRASLQQEADQVLQTAQQNNGKLPQPLSLDQLTQQLAEVIAGVSASNTQRETQAASTATAAITQIVSAMEAKIQSGSEPTPNIATDLDKQFAPINQAFQQALSQIHTDLASQAQTQIQAIDQLGTNAEQSITLAAQQQLAPPTPKVDSQDKTVEEGFPTSFDASGSSALGGASITSVSWTLCDASYKPTQTGVLLPPNTPACRAIPGFSANGGQFQFDTCNLAPADYVARVTVVDSNGKTGAMDVRLHVTQPAYDDPGTRLQNLANAYISLQSQQFLSFFDPTNYPGYTQLQQNIQQTFLDLSSMQINLRVSQASITCNSATVRADWEQKYTFKGDQTCANAAAGSGCQKQVFSQTEQLTARMTRVPGRGWFITDFQGDNGKVQGSAPGPQTTFAAQPNLQVSGLQVVPSASNQQPRQSRARMNDSNSQVTVVGLAPGANRFVATVTNIGNAPLTQQPQLHFAIVDSNGNELASDTENLPTLPLNPGASEQVTGTITVPTTLAPSTQVNVGATVNPGCQVQEQTCGSNNFASVPAVTQSFNIVGTLGPGGAGATVKLSGLSSATVTADSSGNYSFGPLVNGTYTIAPSKSGVTFSPASQSVTINNATAAGPAFTETFTLTGTLGVGGAGATVSLSGVAGTQVADSNGNYTFTGLANGSYTVAPSKTGVTFSSTNPIIVINNSPVATGPVFTEGFTLTGTLGIGGAGATVSLSGVTGTQPADANGNYTFTGLANGTYTVTPTKAGVTFSSTNPSISISNAPASGPAFTETFSLAGTLGVGGAGATVTLSGAASATTTADISGNYTFQALANGTYTITPTKPGVAFSSSNPSVVINNVPANGPSFTETFTISGSLGTIGAGATVTLSGAASATTTADSSGNYSFTGLSNGSYTVTPSGTADAFNPPSQAVTINNGPAVANFNTTLLPAYVITSITSATTPNPPTGANAFQVGQDVTLQIAVANTSATASPSGQVVVQFNCNSPCQLSNPPSATITAPAAGQSAVATVTITGLQLAPATGYVGTATITSAPPQSTTAGNTASLTFDVTDFTVTNTLSLTGDLNVQIGSQGIFNVSLTEPQGLTAVSIPVAAGPAITGVTYTVNSPLTAGGSGPVVVATNATAPAGTSSLVSVTGTRFGVTRSATQSVRFFTASLENFSAGQPGSSQTQPIILPINGAAQSLSLRLTGNFFNPGGGAQLGFPTVTGISITPSATTAAAGDVITVQVQAVQGAAVNQTVPLVFTAQVPNMNPAVPETLTVFVRPTALPDLAISSITVNGAAGARNFTSNPWLSGEPLDFVVTVTNNGPGPSNGFENLHLLLNGSELTRGGVTVPQALQPNTSVNVTVHVDAPDPVATGAGTVTARVDEDAIGDANSSNDSLGIAVTTSDWSIAIPQSSSPSSFGGGSGSSDALALVVPAGSSSTTFIQPTVTGGGDFLTPVTVLNGIVSSRITATPGVTSFTTSQTQVRYAISAASTAAQGFYAAQLIARFVDAGRPTAQRQATVHISVSNANSPGDTVTVTSSRNNACTTGCTPIEINGLLIEDTNLTVTRSSGMTTGSVDLHFSDPSSVVSDVSSTGSPQTPIINGIAYGVAKDVFFAAAQDANGAVVATTNAAVVVSATAIQTSAARGTPTPDAVGPNQTTLLFNVGDLQLSSVSPSCFNIPPGGEGVLQLSFTPLDGFNSPSISWSVASLPAGVVLNNVTPTSAFNGTGYSAVGIDLTNTNPTDVSTAQPLTLVGTISNNNGTATVAFAPTIQLHSGSCVPPATRNAMIEGGLFAGGTRGVWRRGTASGAIARSTMRAVPSSVADVRLIAGDVSYSPSMPKAGDTVQVRFRLTNPGSSEARNVPLALMVNGTVVASDTFDVAPGKTVLGGLQWMNAQLPRGATPGSASAMLVVDPAVNAHATIASGKVAPLSHFSMTGSTVTNSFAQSASGRQRALIELAESACSGFRFSSGASSGCGSADVEISFDDAAAGRFSLNATRGIADLGMNYSGNGLINNLQYTSQLLAAAGHSYAVQLGGGKVGVLTIRGIRNPHQNSATAEKVFHGGAARRVAGRLGKTSGPVETGDVSGNARQTVAAVLDVLYDTP